MNTYQNAKAIKLPKYNSDRWLSSRSLKGEKWLPVTGYEGYYNISSYGRVKSLHKKVPVIIRTNRNKFGREQIVLHHDGHTKTSSVHRLVAEAFLPNPNNLSDVNHKDENPMNNQVNNLEWCTHAYNMRYGTIKQRVSAALKNHPKTSSPIAQYDLQGKFLRIWPSIREVKRTLNARGWKGICSVCKGKAPSALGFQWRYIEDGLRPINNIGPCPHRYSTIPKIVCQYTLLGDFLSCYPSASEAARAVGIAPTNIIACLKGKQKSAAGFQWRYKADLRTPSNNIGQCPTKHLAKSYVVCQYTKDGDFVRSYESVAEAANAVGVSSGNITSCCNIKKQKSTAGYQWRYKKKEEDPIVNIGPYLRKKPPKAVCQFTKDGFYVCQH